jgi:hypothetical protein
MLPSSGDRIDPWAVPASGVENSAPSSTPTRKHFPTSRISDLSSIRSWSISFNVGRSTLSKKDAMSASRTPLPSPCLIDLFSAFRASWALRPGRKPYEQSKKSCS